MSRVSTLTSAMDYWRLLGLNPSCSTCKGTGIDPKSCGMITNVGEARETVYLVGKTPCPTCKSENGAHQAMYQPGPGHQAKYQKPPG